MKGLNIMISDDDETVSATMLHDWDNIGTVFRSKYANPLQYDGHDVGFDFKH